MVYGERMINFNHEIGLEPMVAKWHTLWYVEYIAEMMDGILM